MTEEEEKAQMTSVENLLDSLDCDLDTSYESFVIKLNSTYNNEIDMYGDIRKAGESSLKVKDLSISSHIGFRIWNPYSFLILR